MDLLDVSKVLILSFRKLLELSGFQRGAAGSKTRNSLEKKERRAEANKQAAIILQHNSLPVNAF